MKLTASFGPLRGSRLSPLTASSWSAPVGWVGWLSWVAILGLSTNAGGVEPIALTSQSTVRFADVAEGSMVLSTEDRFTAQMSRFDLQCRMQTTADVRLEDYLQFVRGEVREWSDSDRERILPLLNRIRERFENLSLPLPPEILLVRTSGREESNAAYCRRHAIVLPQSYLSFPPQKLEQVLIHELFHVLSSHNDALRRRMYEQIGFQVCRPIAWPASWKDKKLTNPDGPATDVIIEIQDGDQTRMVAPILYASAEEFDPQISTRLFDYLVFRLMVVEPDGDHWKPSEVDGDLHLLSPRDVPSYHEQIGRNTGYIIHPDEILAENFVHLVTAKADLPNPEIVSRLGEILRKRDR